MSFLKIPLIQKDYNTKENREQCLSPTNLLISLLPAPQLNVKRTIWRFIYILENELLSKTTHVQTIQSSEKRKANQLSLIQYGVQKKNKIL